MGTASSARAGSPKRCSAAAQRHHHGYQAPGRTRTRPAVAEADTGRATGTRATLGLLLERWWEHKVGRLSPTTAREYRRLLDKRISPDLGKRRIDSLTAADLDAYYLRLPCSPAATSRWESR